MKHTIAGLVFLTIISCSNGGNQKVLGGNKMTDITHIFDKKQFEAIVQYVLDKGEIWEFYSQLWGSSPYLEMDEFFITLFPKYENFDDIEEYWNKTCYDVSDFTGMCIGHFMGLASADIKIIGDKVFVTRIINGIPEYDELLDIVINTCIPKMKELLTNRRIN